MRKWLARLSFSLIIIAAVLAWEAWRTRRGDRGPGREWQVYAFAVASVLCFGLGLRGVRERHRMLDEARDDAREDGRDDSRDA
jgi:hypothetical protein